MFCHPAAWSWHDAVCCISACYLSWQAAYMHYSCLLMSKRYDSWKQQTCQL